MLKKIPYIEISKFLQVVSRINGNLVLLNNKGAGGGEQGYTLPFCRLHLVKVVVSVSISSPILFSARSSLPPLTMHSAQEASRWG